MNFPFGLPQFSTISAPDTDGFADLRPSSHAPRSIAIAAPARMRFSYSTLDQPFLQRAVIQVIEKFGGQPQRQAHVAGNLEQT